LLSCQTSKFEAIELKTVSASMLVRGQAQSSNLEDPVVVNEGFGETEMALSYNALRKSISSRLWPVRRKE
jgi:hypothetical protein